MDRFSLGYNTDSEKEKFVLYSAVMSMISFQTFACLLYFTTIPHKQPLYFQRLINEQKLHSIRNKLDDIDKSIIRALAQRQQVVKEVAALNLQIIVELEI